MVATNEEGDLSANWNESTPWLDVLSLQQDVINVLLGSGSGSVGRSGASNTRGFRF